MTVLATLMLFSWCQTAMADEQITLSAKSEEIADGLDLRAVANLFARSKDLQAFEKTLNNPDSAFTNLDLNGDGDVDYIRVVETTQGRTHTIVLQAILAKDIFQDVATIVVEKDNEGSVSVTVTGDERIYGVNYVIEPVFYYRPIIYDWFWGPNWYVWNSPYYWGYWPGWWRPFPPCTPVIYVNRCMCCCNRGGCSYRTSAPVRTHDAVRTQRVAMAREGAARVDGRAAGAATRTAGRASGATAATRATAAQRTVGSAAATRAVDRAGLSRTTTVASATRQQSTTAATTTGRQLTTTGATRQQTTSIRQQGTTATTTTSRPTTTTASRPQVTTTATRPQTTMTASVSRPSTTTATTGMRSSSSSSSMSTSRPASQGYGSRPAQSYGGGASRSAGFSGGSGFSGGHGGGGFSGGGAGHSGGGRR